SGPTSAASASPRSTAEPADPLFLFITITTSRAFPANARLVAIYFRIKFVPFPINPQFYFNFFTFPEQCGVS
ncbi:MAG: hypothetical protein ACI4PD_07470, partial [Butyricicoccus sp.]